MDQDSVNNEQLSIKFEGETTIEANTLLNALTNILHSYEASIRASAEDSNYEIRINTFKEGSFDVIIDTVVKNAPVIIGYAPTAVECVKNFVEMIKIKRELLGKKPQRIENDGSKTAITNANGETNYYNSTVTNIFLNNPVIDSGLSNAFGVVGAGDRPAFTISGAKEHIQIPQAEYEAMKVPVISEQYLATLQTMESDVEELLLLKSPDFLGDSKWAFQYKGRTIHATIADEEFQERVKKGKVSLSAGVKLPVKMHIVVTLDESLEPVKHTYTIVKVTGPVVKPGDYEEEQHAIQEVYFDEE